MKYADIKFPDVANGPGIRISLFVSGCTAKCKNCFNPEAWDFNYGKEFTKDTEAFIIGKLVDGYVNGLSILGGEPFHPYNIDTVLSFIKKVKLACPTAVIWVWTGYLFENLMKKADSPEKSTFEELLPFLDTIVDGPFIEEKKDLSLRFRGSSNQRIINVPMTMKTYSTDKKVILRSIYY